jgi:hypothetical protein
MRKSEELTNPASCMMRTAPEEMTFVLLARDSCAPFAIRCWARARVRSGKNSATDAQIIEALACADKMEMDRLSAIG